MSVPREIENNASAKFGGGGGANKVHYGKSGSGVWMELAPIQGLLNFSCHSTAFDIKA